MRKIYLVFMMLALTIYLHAQNQYVAHRGASYLAPENTVAAAKLAWDLGADAVEVDVHLSKDNRVMVIHDKDSKRTCSGKKNLVIKDTPSMLLRDLDAGIWKSEDYKGERIPFLKEVIETIPEGKFLVVEVKCGSEILPALTRSAEKSGKMDQLVFISFGWKTILDLQEGFPNNKCYWLSGNKQGLAKKMDQAVKGGLTGVNLNHRIIDEALVKQAKEKGLEVLTYTVDEPAEVKRLQDIGVTVITTNRPKWLKEEVSRL